MHRQRPLQNSMILPETNYSSNHRPSIQPDFNFQNQPLKIIPGINGESQFIPHHNVIMQQTRQFASQNSFEEHQQILRNNDPVHEIFDRLEKLSRVVDKHDLQLGSLLQEGELSRRVLLDLNKKTPAFNGNNDISEQLLTLKLEIKDLHQELAKTPKMAELEQNIKKQIQASTNKNNESSSSIIYPNSSKTSDFESINELIRKRDEHYQNLLSNLEIEISMVKRNLGNMHLEMKVSPITSSSCILVKYQELFKAKNTNENDMVINEYTYYIDNEGHLLDCHSRYILDQKGKKIKLEDKHINILRNQKILY